MEPPKSHGGPDEKEIFLEALSIDDPAERESWLDEQCGEDLVLRQRVGSLLGSAARDDDFLEPDETGLGRALEAAGKSAGLPAAGEGSIRYFGDYELLEEIASGAMGVVFRARQSSLNRSVAVKMIRGTLLASDSDVQRFQAEAEAAASLDHPNIVPIYEIGQHGDQHYFSMKLFEGGTLADHMDELAGDPERAVPLMITIARAVHAAHQYGIIHRDLKPGNILMDEDGTPHVTDFGLAKQLEGDSGLTLSGQIVGTPYYMAPEQAGSSRTPLTTSADVYSLGAMLYEMLSGNPPFGGDDVLEVLRRSREESAPRLTHGGVAIDRDLRIIVSKCLEKESDQRYGSAAALADDLACWMDGRPIAARPVSAAERLLKWIRRHPYHAAFSAVAAMLVLLLAVGGPIVAYQQNQLRQQAERAENEFRMNLAQSLEHSAPGSVPYILGTLQQKQTPEIVELLEKKLDGAAPGSTARSRIAAALSLLGQTRWDELLDPIPSLPVEEGPGISMALEANPGPAVSQLLDRFEQAEFIAERNRLAILLLSLGESGPAMKQLALGPDLSERVDLIDQSRDWHGSLEFLPDLLVETSDADFRSALCLIAGGLRAGQVPEPVMTRVGAALETCYLEYPDGGTHGAAEWALRRLGIPVPELEPSTIPAADRDWFVNGQGFKMIAVPPGLSFPDDYVRMEETGRPPRDGVIITEELYFSWAPITEEEFTRVIDQAIQAGVLPRDLKRVLRDPFRVEMLPIAGVNIFYAALFCNALSGLEGYAPAYELDLSSKSFTWNRDADGYRLPTDAEWEHALRAGTETRFLTGPTDKHLAAYARIHQMGFSADRDRRPNPAGLFDMPGNAWEMTVDRGALRGSPMLVNPVAEIGERTALRGGPPHGGSYFYHSSARNPAEARRVRHSFRVVLGAPGPEGTEFSADRLISLLGWPDSHLSLARRKYLARALESEGREEEASEVRSSTN